MLELDAILQPYFEQQFLSLTPSDQENFERLLTCTDPELFSWFIGSSEPEDLELCRAVTLIKNTAIQR
jgi:antitoxin CptB